MRCCKLEPPTSVGLAEAMHSRLSLKMHDPKERLIGGLFISSECHWASQGFSVDPKAGSHPVVLPPVDGHPELSSLGGCKPQFIQNF